MTQSTRKWHICKIQVGPDCQGARLDQFLPRVDTFLSRTLVKKIIDLGGVHVNGRRVRTCSLILKQQDRVELYCDHLPLEPFRISQQDLVFQDNYLIVLNKPPFIETQPTPARYKGTLYEALQVHLSNPYRSHHRPEIGMVQRLDRSTSGLIAFSIHPAAHRQMTAMFHQHTIIKEYLALVAGRPSPAQGEIRSNLVRGRHGNRVQSVVSGGKPAITRYRTCRDLSGHSLLEVTIPTGRSHQIRAHLSEAGCPLLGDLRYGGPAGEKDLVFSRAMLHSSRLSFTHPVTGEILDFRLPVPEDMQRVIEGLAAVDDLSVGASEDDHVAD